MPHTIRNAQGEKLGVLPDSLPETRELFSPAGSREAVIPAGQLWTTPPYTVGAHTLEVFLEGLACAAGDAAAAQYRENGAQGASSTSISFHFDVAPDADVLFRVRQGG